METLIPSNDQKKFFKENTGLKIWFTIGAPVLLIFFPELIYLWSILDGVPSYNELYKLFNSNYAIACLVIFFVIGWGLKKLIGISRVKQR